MYNKDFVQEQLAASAESIANFGSATDEQFRSLYEQVREKTMLSYPKLWDLYGTMRYINQAEIAGDVVEVGVWRGGVLGLGMLSDESGERSFVGFDTFEGHLRTDLDETDIRGTNMQRMWDRHASQKSRMAYATFEECRNFLEPLVGPSQTLRLVKGNVVATARDCQITSVSVLRLDCDWYRETMFSLDVFWDIVTPGGVVYLTECLWPHQWNEESVPSVLR